VIRAFAALILASAAAATASASTTGTLSSSSPWWEKVTVTIAGDGSPQSCTFQSSLTPTASSKCDIDATQASYAQGKSSSGSKDQFTRITFERRFSPGAQGEITGVGAGEKFLGGQVMALAIDAKGSVKGCKIVATSGSMAPDYTCDDAAAEKFDASAGAGHANAPARQGYMTVLVYGHSEHMV
jgi:hypothetical protein